MGKALTVPSALQITSIKPIVTHFIDEKSEAQEGEGRA